MSAPVHSYFASLNVTVRFTDHALKRARKRFSLLSSNAARQFILDELERAFSSSPGHDGCTSWETPHMTLITKPVDDGRGLLIVTCYPNADFEHREAPGRRSRMSAPRYRERRRSVKQQVRFEVERQLHQLGYHGQHTKYRQFD